MAEPLSPTTKCNAPAWDEGASSRFHPSSQDAAREALRLRAFALLTGRLPWVATPDSNDEAVSPPGSPVVFACAAPWDSHSLPLADGRVCQATRPDQSRNVKFARI